MEQSSLEFLYSLKTVFILIFVRNQFRKCWRKALQVLLTKAGFFERVHMVSRNHTKLYCINVNHILSHNYLVFGGIALVLGNILLGPAAIICGFVATKTESPDTARLLRLIGACVGIVGIVMMVIFWPIMITFIVRWIFLYIKWCPDLKQGCKSGVILLKIIDKKSNKHFCKIYWIQYFYWIFATEYWIIWLMISQYCILNTAWE